MKVFPELFSNIDRNPMTLGKKRRGGGWEKKASTVESRLVRKGLTGVGDVRSGVCAQAER